MLQECSQLELKLTPIKITSNEGNSEEGLIQENHNNEVESKVTVENIAIVLEPIENSELLESSKSLIKSEYVEQEIEAGEDVTHEIKNSGK